MFCNVTPFLVYFTHKVMFIRSQFIDEGDRDLESSENPGSFVLLEPQNEIIRMES